MSNLLTLRSFCCCCSSPLSPASLLPEPEDGRAEYSVQSIYWGFPVYSSICLLPSGAVLISGINLTTVPCVTTQALQCYLWQLHVTTVWWRWNWWWQGVSLHACGCVTIRPSHVWQAAVTVAMHMKGMLPNSSLQKHKEDKHKRHPKIIHN